MSDIHFRSFLANSYIFQADLQNELKRDALLFCQHEGLAPAAILVSGDVAFSGQTSEFESAARWLVSLAEGTGAQPECVLTIPGNHDVQRDVVVASELLRMIHKELRPLDPASIDERLDKYLTKDREAAELLLRPVSNYNAFAARFECDINARQPCWERDLLLNDGSILRIRGMTSTLASDEADDDGSNKLCIGSLQSTFQRNDGIEYLAMCHHPPSWLRDQDRLEDQLNTRTRLQLFGHKHRQRLIRIEDSVRMAAGAVGPDPREPVWEPRYNFVTIEVHSGPPRRMMVRIYPRIWDGASTRFVAESGEVPFKEYDLPLAPWTPSVVQREPGQPVESVPSGERQTSTAVRSQGEAMDRRRVLTYRFLTLPYPVRFEVAQTLALIDETDRGLTETEVYRLWFRRAAERNLLRRLWDEVDKRHEAPTNANPFNQE